MGNVIAFPNREQQSSETPLVALYSASEAARLARVPRHRLYDWRDSGIIFPTISVRTDDQEEERYSFEALVYLRLLRMLREDAGVALPRAVKAIKALVERFGEPGPRWAEGRIFIDGQDVYVDSADSFGVTVASKRDARSGQKLAEPLFGPAFALLRERADSLLIPTRFQRHIEIDPNARSGMPIILGTTLQTATIYALHKRGLKEQEIREHYPRLSPAQVRAAIGFERLLELAA